MYSVGRNMQRSEQLALINLVGAAIPFTGKVDLKHPEHVFCIILEYQPSHAVAAASCDEVDMLPYNPDETPTRCSFVKRVAESNRKTVLAKYSLKSRKYLVNIRRCMID